MNRRTEVQSTSSRRWKTSTIVLYFLAWLLLGATISYLVDCVWDVWIIKHTECQSCNATTTLPPSVSAIDLPAEDLRLSQSIKPLLYDLSIEPDNRNDEYTGQVGITVLALQKTDTIKLHSHQLQIEAVEVLRQSNYANVTRKDHYFEAKKQLLVIPLWDQLDAGVEYLINIKFRGSFANKTVGYFKGSYVINCRTSLFSATKFEPTYARQAFPCFDEPNLKAAIKMKITHDKNQKALANMPVDEETTIGNKTVTKFKQSPLNMSTYLIAWAVGEFDSIGAMTTSGKEVRVFARLDQLSQTRFALETAVAILEFYEQYFDIPFSLPKLDLIAFHFVFSIGAMESWGLITIQENLLLYDPKLSSAGDKKRIAAIISQVMVKNWFGNLVTMDWWNDLWLKEGFASFIKYKAVANAKPDWAIDEHFLIDDLHPAMALDSMLTSHPIVQEVENPDQIAELFDSIPYSKTASVLQMLEDTIGAEVFKTGVRNFLKKFKEKSAKTSDFWKEMDLVLDKNSTIKSVVHFMNKWTTDKNFPVVNVVRTDQGLSLTQQRFLMKQDKNPIENEIEKPWIIPIKLITEDGDKLEFILGNKTKHFQLPFNITEKWFKLNPNQVGYYIVNYTNDDWVHLTWTQFRNLETRSPMDRANLLFDAFQLAKSNQLNYQIALKLSTYLEHEEHLIPWTTANRALTELIDLMSNSDGSYIKEFVKGLTDKIYRTLGWEFSGRPESSNIKMLRTLIVNLACRSGNEDCLNEAALRLKQLIQDGKQIDGDVRSAVYKYGMQQSNDRLQWEWFFYWFTTETVAAEKSRLLAGLTSVQNTGLLLRLINSVLDDCLVSKQDVFTVLSSVANNAKEKDLVWDFIQDQWTTLVDMFTLKDRSNLARFISDFVSRFNKQRQLDQVEAFFKRYPDAEQKQALENIRNNIEWMKNKAKSLNKVG